MFVQVFLLAMHLTMTMFMYFLMNFRSDDGVAVLFALGFMFFNLVMTLIAAVKLTHLIIGKEPKW